MSALAPWTFQNIGGSYPHAAAPSCGPLRRGLRCSPGPSMVATYCPQFCWREACEDREKKAPKRRLSGQALEAHKARLHSDATLTKLTRKPCDQRCMRSCLRKFAGAVRFPQLKAFREQWSELHKLDQDNVAPWIANYLAFLCAEFMN